MFKQANVGTVDRVLRIVVGIVLIALPYLIASTMWDNPALRWGVPIIGLVLVLTALFRFCPLYRLVGASTCRANQSETRH